MPSPIESFIKKFRSAQAAKSKDMRISMDEAASIIGAFAAIQTDKEAIDKQTMLLENLVKALNNQSNQSSDMDGGSF